MTPAPIGGTPVVLGGVMAGRFFDWLVYGKGTFDVAAASFIAIAVGFAYFGG